MDEIKRLEVVQQIERKQLTGKQAARRLRLSERQVKRLIAMYRGQGPPGLVHGNRGRVANNRIAEETRVLVPKPFPLHT
ncbi:MAG: helix-turn-helix domain-containing protein [Anaerolineales bacterium]|nr:helix-turn-helix domain-containing protein [Anaerolineales bacterium]